MYKLSVLVSCSHIEFANWFVAGLCRGCEIKCCWLKKHRRIEQNSYLNCACMIYVPLIRSFALTPHDSIWVCTHSQHTEWEWCSCYCFYKHLFACTLAIIYFGISLFGNSGVHTQHTYNCWMKKNMFEHLQNEMKASSFTCPPDYWSEPMEYSTNQARKNETK